MKQTNLSQLVRVSETELGTILIALSSLLKLPRSEVYELIAADCEQAWRDKYTVATAMERLRKQLESMVK